MPEREWTFRLHDILEAIQFVSEHLDGLTFEEFASNELLVRAVLHTLEVAGEATRGIPEDVTSQHPEIPWRGLNAFRNVLVHQYFRVDLELVWRVIHNNFLPLEDAISRLLDSLPRDA